MHDEFERAVTGERPRKGLSALGWLVVGMGFFMVVGIFGVGWAVTQMTHRAKDVAARLASDFRPAAAASRIVSHLRAHERLLDLTPDEGLRYLQDLDPGDPAEAMLESLVSAPLRTLGEDARRTSDPTVSQGSRSERESSLTIRSDEGDVRFDFQRGDDGASLVIDSNDGQVRIDLGRTKNGGFLTIDSEDGRARFDLVRTADGGTLTIESEEGTIRVDAEGSEDGARLRIRSDDGELLRLGVGDEAEAMPGWVPRVDGMPGAPRPVYSLSADEGLLGGVTWTSDRSVDHVLDFYRSRLEDEGYELRAEHAGRDGDGRDGSLWARDEAADRLVFVVARESSQGTSVLLGYGQRN